MDNFTGTSGNDTFIADNTGTNQFTAADKLDGGNGTDTLTIYGYTPGDGIAQISNIESVVLDSSADSATAVNLSTVSGIKDVTVSRAVGQTNTTVADGVTVTLSSNADNTKTQKVNFGSTDTSATLILNKVDTSSAGVTQTGAAVTTLNIKTTGAASNVGTLTTGTTATTLNVSGDQNLTITNTAGGLAGAAYKIDATNLTGKLSVVTADATAAGSATAPSVSVIGGSGADTVDIRASGAADFTSVSTGAGDDTVKVTNAQITGDTTDKLTGGDGTDTLVIDFANDAGATQATDLSSTITGFEKISVISNNTAAQTHTLAMGTNKLGISDIAWDGDSGDTLAITGLAASSTVRVNNNAVAVSAAIGTDTTADTVTFNLDGTTVGTLTATNYETVNIASSKDSSGNTNALTTGTLSSATKVVLTGAGALVGGTITTAANATVDASGYSGDLTATTFGANVKTYIGGSGEDQITLVAGGLKQGNSFDGGAGTSDTLTVTATSGQDMGIVALTGFETVNLTSNHSAGDTVTGDFRNVTGLTTLNIVAGDASDNFTLNRLSADTGLTFGSTMGNVVTTINSGTSQKVAFSGNYTVGSLTLDSGTTTLTVTSNDGDTTPNEAGGVFTFLSGSSLTTIVLDGLDRTNLGTVGTTVTSIDASASKGGLTVIASATATSIIGSQAADTITGGGAADTIRGGKGNDTLDGGAGADSYVFEATGAANGQDTIALVAGAGGDILNFKNFLAGGSVDQNGGTGTAIAAYTSANTSDVNITNKVALYSDASYDGTAVASTVAALIQGSGNAFSLSSGGKAIIITGDASGNNDKSQIWYIDDALDGNAGTVSATDVVLVGTTASNMDLDTLITSNFAFA